MRQPSHSHPRHGRSSKKRQHPTRPHTSILPSVQTRPIPSSPSPLSQPRRGLFVRPQFSERKIGMFILTIFFLLYAFGYYSVASGEQKSPGGVDEAPTPTLVTTQPTKHYLLQPPGENNGNVLPGAVLLDSKSFENDKDANVPQKRDVNVLPGAIGLTGAFDEGEPVNIMGGNVPDAETLAEGKPDTPDKVAAAAEKLNNAAVAVAAEDVPTKESEKKVDGKNKKGKQRKKRKRKEKKKPTAADVTSPDASKPAADANAGKEQTAGKKDDTEKRTADKDEPDKGSGTSRKDGVSAKPKDGVDVAADANESPGPLYTGPHAMNRQMTELQVPGDGGELDDGAVKSHYEKLVKAYLAPFSEGIPRESFFKILKRRTYALAPPGSNKGVQTLLFQLHGKKVHLLDPYEIAKNSKPFYKTRIQELIWLLSDIAKGGIVPNTEFLVAIHDCVQTVNQEHEYRGSVYKESSPTFTIVSCNFSDNIPFPMWEGDPVRGGLKSWDTKMEQYRSSDSTPWEQKQNKAVFRGGNRPSMYFKKKRDANEHCHDVGRTRLAYLSEQNTNLFDVGVSGKCGAKVHNMEHLSESAHHAYKYILYAEGNCFWADRLNKQVFGPSAVIKQETPCGQFWEPLLKPMTHYIPTDFFFSDTVSQITWAKDNDEKVKEIVAKANQFAKAFLSVKGIKTYVEVLLVEYTKLLKNREFQPEKGSKDVTLS